MNTYQHLKVITDGPLVRIALNRPEKMNALDYELLKELLQCCRDVQQLEDARCLILEGSGRAFSVGYDLKMMVSAGGLPSESELKESALLGEQVIAALRNVPQVTIASVHGYAIGGGFLLMGACDFRVVSKRTRFSLPEVDIGIPLTWGGVPLLIEALGPSRAKEYVMTCRQFGPEELTATGFIHRLVSADDRERETEKLAELLSKKAALPLRLSKKQFLQHSSPDYLQRDRERFTEAALDPEFLPTAMAYMQQLFNRK